jgi:hypothetical protein
MLLCLPILESCFDSALLSCASLLDMVLIVYGERGPASSSTTVSSVGRDSRRGAAEFAPHNSSRSWLRDRFPITWDGVALLRFEVRRPRTTIASASLMSRFCCASIMSS